MSLRPLSVVLVSGSRALSDVVQRVCEELGFDCTHFGAGHLLDEIADALHFDAAILDHEIGHDELKLAQRLIRAAHVVVASSSLFPPESIGAHFLVLKPVSQLVLSRALSDIAHQQQNTASQG
jgi:hypothetical protein